MSDGRTDTPLGRKTGPQASDSGCRFPAVQAIAAAFALFLRGVRRSARCSATTRSAASRRRGPRSSAAQPATKPPRRPPARTSPPGARARPRPPRPPSGRPATTVTIIDGSSGARKQVVVPSESTGATVESDVAPTPAPEQSETAGAEPLRRDPDRGRRPQAVRRLCRRRAADRAKAAKSPTIAHRRRRPRRRRSQDRRRHHQAARRGDARLHALWLRSRQAGRAGPRRSATRCCCRCRWSRSTIPTTIPARRRC